jgi:beta-glucosidase
LTPIDYYHDQGVLPLVNDVNGNPIGKASACDWLYVVPSGMEKLLVWIKNRYNNPPIIITENGVAMPNEENMKIDELI